MKKKSGRKKTSSSKTIRDAHGRICKNKWSALVRKTSIAPDIALGVFKHHIARQIAISLMRSARASRRRKAGPFQSDMAMLNFFINSAGQGFPARRRSILESAKKELRKVFNRQPGH